MPELPEVEVWVRALRPRLEGRSIERVTIHRTKLIAEPGVRTFVRRLEGRRIAVKQVLLDPSVVAGVGNIHASEACFRSRLDPRTLPRRVRGLRSRGGRVPYVRYGDHAGRARSAQHVLLSALPGAT